MTETSSEAGASADETSADEGTATKGPARKRAPRKTTAKKGAAKKAAPRKASARTEPAPKKMTGARVAGEAARQLLQLTGKEPEGIIGLERTDDGWKVVVEVLELRRIPNTTDVLATFEVTVDNDGDLEGYKRLHRYVRGTPGDN